MRRFEVLDETHFGVSFPYNEKTIQKVKTLAGRKWNAKEKRWELPLSQLGELLNILQVDPRNVPRPLMTAYEKQWGGGVEARLLVGNCFTRLAGRKLPLAQIEEATSFWVEGAEHTDRYKKGQWDGRKRLLRKKKEIEFPTGLLPRVQAILDQKRLQYELVEPARPDKSALELQLRGIQLRDYQEQSVAKALEAERGVLQMATGSGKTVVAAAMIARLHQPALFFVHTKDLLYQAKTYFEQFLGVEVGQIGDGVVHVLPVTVATIQTTSRALGIKISKEELEDGEEKAITAREQIEAIQKKAVSTPLVFFDECHHLPASSCYSIAMKSDAAYYRFGLSATPYRSDRQDLMIEAAVGPKVVTVDSSLLIRKGYLVRPRIHFIPIPPTLQTRRYVRYHTVYQHEVVENAFRNQTIAALAKRYAQVGETVLILVTQVKHGQLLADLLPDAVLLTGRDRSGFRVETLDALRDRTQKIVIATTLADEGLDIPELDVLILAGAGKSETRALQRIGRALRKTERKTHATVIDFYDQARFLEVHSQRRFEIYKTEEEFDIRMEDDFGEGNRSVSKRHQDLFEGMRAR